MQAAPAVPSQPDICFTPCPLPQGKLGAVYTEDATLLPPGSPPIRGRDGIRQVWQAVMDSGVRAVSLQTDDLEVAGSGDLAREIGTGTLTIRGAGGQRQTATVKIVVVWKRQGGA